MTASEYNRMRGRILQKDPKIQEEAAKLRAWRKDHGYTQRDIEERYQVRQCMISLAENAKLRVPPRLRPVLGIEK